MTNEQKEKHESDIEKGKKEIARYGFLADTIKYIVDMLEKRENELRGKMNGKTASCNEILEYERVRASHDAAAGEWSQAKTSAGMWEDAVKTHRDALAEGEDA